VPRFFFLTRSAAMEEEAAPSRRLSWRWFLPALLVSTAALKLAFAAAYPGFHSGDDLEIVEAAARTVLGFPYEPWNIRSLFHPIVFVAPFLAIGDTLGFHGARALVFLATIPTTIFSTAGIWLLWRLTRELDWDPPAGRAAAFLYAVHTLPLAYGSMPYPRPISTAFLLAAFVLLARNSGGAGSAFVAGLAAAAAMTVRWSEGVLFVPLLAFAAWKTRSAATLARVAAGFAAGVLLFVGLFDRLTWGSLFASLLAFERFGADPSAVGVFPHRPWFWYGTNLLGWAGPLLVLLAAAGIRDRRSRMPLLLAASTVAILSLSPMKQPRYVQAAVPFLAMAAAIGWERIRTRSRTLAVVLLAAAIPLGLERTLHLLDHKSLSAFAAARQLAATKPPRAIVFEQAWAWGEALPFAPGTAVRDLAPKTPLRADDVLAATNGAQALGLYVEDMPRGLAVSLGPAWKPCGSLKIGRSPEVRLFLAKDLVCPPGWDAGVSGAPPGS
jgi:hypothetical protein